MPDEKLPSGIDEHMHETYSFDSGKTMVYVKITNELVKQPSLLDPDAFTFYRHIDAQHLTSMKADVAINPSGNVRQYLDVIINKLFKVQLVEKCAG